MASSRPARLVAATISSGVVLLLTARTLRQNHKDDDDVTHAQQQGAAHGGAPLSRWSSVGLPGEDTIYIEKENFVICYDARTRNPKWVMERVSRATCTGDADRRVVGFYEEKTSILPSAASIVIISTPGMIEGTWLPRPITAARHKRCKRRLRWRTCRPR